MNSFSKAGGATKSSGMTASKKAFFKKNASKKEQDRMKMDELYENRLNKMVETAKGGGAAKFGILGKGGDMPEKEVSNSAMMIMQQMAKKAAKKDFKEYKKSESLAEIKAKYYVGPQGGRIDAKGRIYDAAQQHVMTVDQKTGKIKNRWGNVVGTYDPESGMNDWKISELIKQYDTRKPKSGLWAFNGNDNSGGSIWGSPGGSGGGSIWGNNDDNNGGGFWG